MKPSQYDKAHARKINNMLSRGQVNTVTNNSGYVTAQANLMNSEVAQSLEYAQDFGFASHPPVGAELVAGFFGGNRDHGHIFKAFHKPSVPTILQPGEACLHSTFAGSYFVVSNDGSVKLITPGGDITVTAAGGLVMNITSWTINGTNVPLPP